MYYTFKKLKQDVIGLQTCGNTALEWGNDEIINFIK